jgi:hypothetical protein
MKNMKGFVFTLDAVFALIVATVGISIIVYAHYISQGSYQTQQSTSYYLMQSLLNIRVAGTANNLYVSGYNINSTLPGYNLLNALAYLYLNNKGTYANQVLHDIVGNQSVAIFINNTYAPDIGMMSFNSFSNSVIYGNGVYAFPLTNLDWIYPTSYSTNGFTAIAELDGGSNTLGFYNLGMSNTGNLVVWNGKSYVNSILVPSLNQWDLVGFTINNINVVVYSDGQSQSLGASTTNSASSNTFWSLGLQNSLSSGNNFAGTIAGVLVYNGPISSTQTATLYQQGIFSAPPTKSNLTAWWPLDGNANDISGGNNNGTTSKITLYKSTYLPRSLLNGFSVSKSTVPISITSNNINIIYNVSVVAWK